MVKGLVAGIRPSDDSFGLRNWRDVYRYILLPGEDVPVEKTMAKDFSEDVYYIFYIDNIYFIINKI
jgi:hypothetical protein